MNVFTINVAHFDDQFAFPCINSISAIVLRGDFTRKGVFDDSNPKQQIAYLGVKYWARLYCPEVILGVYNPDEVEQRTGISSERR